MDEKSEMQGIQKRFFDLVDEIIPADEEEVIRIFKEELFSVEIISTIKSAADTPKFLNIVISKLEYVKVHYPHFFTDSRIDDWFSSILHTHILKNYPHYNEIEILIKDMAFASPAISREPTYNELLQFLNRKKSEPTFDFTDNTIDKIEFHYWKHPPNKLTLLYDLLLQEKIIAENQFFCNSFLNSSVPIAFKTVWQIKSSSLFALLYLLLGKGTHYGTEHISEIILKLFTGKGFENEKNIRQGFANFMELVNEKYLRKNHKAILSIIQKLQLQNS